MKTAIVLGATGLTGSHLVEILLKSSEYENIIVFVRKELNIKNRKLTQYIIDFENIDYYQDLIRCDDMFCCLGTTIKKAGSQENFKKVDYDYPVHFARIAKQNGTAHFLMISSIGANAKSSNFYLRTKGEVEEVIKGIQFESTSIFRPSILVGDRKEFRLGEKIGTFFARIMSVFMLGKLRKYRPVKATQVAQAMYRVAQSQKSGATVYESDAIQKL